MTSPERAMDVRLREANVWVVELERDGATVRRADLRRDDVPPGTPSSSQ